jgi:hypothetical protein
MSHFHYNPSVQNQRAVSSDHRVLPSSAGRHYCTDGEFSSAKGPSGNNLKGTIPSKPKMDDRLIDGRALSIPNGRGFF